MLVVSTIDIIPTFYVNATHSIAGIVARWQHEEELDAHANRKKNKDDKKTKNDDADRKKNVDYKNNGDKTKKRGNNCCDSISVNSSTKVRGHPKIDKW
ncbi:hypothetical protein TELCIR_16709 [Teladorsagia circumcincta]|uniref:Uncharacterized protein n=1 Tax=Teladorsagia circumcincta TaxID=45464 RepID=A0A2G9TV02_TELCI|nr:hypothetical protein TELCIR_16709 [Teladorsagia circumcincta]